MGHHSRCGGILPTWADQEESDLFRNRISIMTWMTWITHPSHGSVQIDAQKVFFADFAAVIHNSQNDYARTAMFFTFWLLALLSFLHDAIFRLSGDHS
jgi:hypothetical protein